MAGMRKFFSVAFVLSLILSPASCSVNPVSGQHELMLLSEKDELALGRQTDSQITHEYGIYKDKRLNRRVQEMGSRLGRISHRPDLSYQVQILDAPVVNAFAVPGGYIYLTRGIMAYLNSEAELAAIMGHEIGHVTARHSGQQYTRAQLAQVGMGIGMIFSDAFSSLSSLVQMGVGMLFLSYSRDNELQADSLAVEYCAKAGYEPGEMAGFFQTLERLNPSSDRTGLPSWFSTHPSPEDRIGRVRSLSKEWVQKLNGANARVGRDEYLKQIDGLIYGEDPKQGYVKDHVFYHPELRFQFPIPEGWNHNNTPSQVQIGSKNGEAAVVLTIVRAATPKKAAQDFIAKSRPLVHSSQPLQVNGLDAHRLITEVQASKGRLAVVSYFIELERKVFVFHGLSERRVFQEIGPLMEETMRGFKKIKDRKRIDVEPDRLRIRTVKSGGTMEDAVLSMGFSRDDAKEFALLNGRNPEDRVKAGTLIKVVEKGRS